jgi:hypothetical protein
VIDVRTRTAATQAILTADHPMTLRQVHCALFSRELPGYKNDKACYRSLSRILRNARRLHREWELYGYDGVEPAFGIPSSWIVDELLAASR